MADQLGDAGRPGGHRREPVRHRLRDHQAEGVVDGWVKQEIGRVIRGCGILQGADPVQPVEHAGPLRPLHDGAPRRARHYGEPHTGYLPYRLQGRVNPLAEIAYKQRDNRVRRKGEGPASVRMVFVCGARGTASARRDPAGPSRVSYTREAMVHHADAVATAVPSRDLVPDLGTRRNHPTRAPQQASLSLLHERPQRALAQRCRDPGRACRLSPRGHHDVRRDHVRRGRDPPLDVEQVMGLANQAESQREAENRGVRPTHDRGNAHDLNAGRHRRGDPGRVEGDAVNPGDARQQLYHVAAGAFAGGVLMDRDTDVHAVSRMAMSRSNTSRRSKRSSTMRRPARARRRASSRRVRTSSMARASAGASPTG